MLDFGLCVMIRGLVLKLNIKDSALMEVAEAGKASRVRALGEHVGFLTPQIGCLSHSLNVPNYRTRRKGSGMFFDKAKFREAEFTMRTAVPRPASPA